MRLIFITFLTFTAASEAVENIQKIVYKVTNEWEGESSVLIIYQNISSRGFPSESEQN